MRRGESVAVSQASLLKCEGNPAKQFYGAHRDYLYLFIFYVVMVVICLFYVACSIDRDQDSFYFFNLFQITHIVKISFTSYSFTMINSMCTYFFSPFFFFTFVILCLFLLNFSYIYLTMQ